MPDSLPDKPVSQAFQPSTTSDLGGKPSSEEQPTVPPKPPVSPSISPMPPAEPPTSPPISPTPPSMPPTEEPGIPMQKPTDKEGSQKAKIVGAVLGLLFLVVALPATIYLIQQRQYIWPGAVYPSPSPSAPPENCEAQLQTEAEDRELCDHGSEAKVYVWATRGQGEGCSESSVSYKWKKSSCCGDEYEDCEIACSEHQETHSGTITIPAGQTSSGKDTVSCRIPDDCGEECAACQVDVVEPDGWGQMAWRCPEETPPPEYEATCEDCLIYDKDWKEITDPSTISVGQTVYFATLGSTDHPEGITKARFRISVDEKVGQWQETTEYKWATSEGRSLFYIEYTIASAGRYKVESMVYNPVLGWK